MSGDGTESASESLRELARWIVRDGVDNQHLEVYMGGLLSRQFIELPASCRYEAMVLARCYVGLDARDLANHLCRRACELERVSSALAAAAPRGVRQQTASPDLRIPRTGPVRDGPPACRARWQLWSWLPQLIAGIICAGMGVFLFYSDCDDSILRVTAGSGYSLLGLIYAIAGLQSAWRNAPAGGRR